MSNGNAIWEKHIAARFTYRPVVSMTVASSPSKYSECSRGTGRLSVETTYTRRCFVRPIHSLNSTVFGVVAERKTMDTCSGSMMITSSQTTPRSMSFT